MHSKLLLFFHSKAVGSARKERHVVRKTQSLRRLVSQLVCWPQEQNKHLSTIIIVTSQQQPSSTSTN